MPKSISTRKNRFFMGALTIITALFLSVVSVPAAETPPGEPVAPPIPPELTPAELSALTPQEKVARAEALSAAASFKATQALQTGDLALAQEAQALANEATDIISGVAEIAADTGDIQLAQAALNASLSVGEALNIVVGAAGVIAATSTDPNTVEAANTLQASATSSQSTNTTSQQTAMATGASMAAAEEAYEAPEGTPPVGPTAFNPPVVDSEPPITDLPPASPV
jgi:hypothetical protein